MNTDPQLLKQCAVKGAEAASLHLNPCKNVAVETGSIYFEQDEPARIAFAQAAIEHYLKLNPVWISTRDRLPTKEDEDEAGTVGVFSQEAGFTYNIAERVIRLSKQHFWWCSVKSIPAESIPDPEREKFEQWYEKQQASMPGTKEQLFQLWKAAKES